MDQNALLADDVSLSYSFSMLEMVTLDDAISYTLMCRNKRFIVDVSVESLGREGELVDTFYDFKDNLDDPDVFCDFETWIMDAIDEHIKLLVPASDSVSRMPTTTLLDYYDSETFVFELVNRNGMLETIKHPYDPKLHGDTRPKVIIVDSVVNDTNSVAESLRTPAIGPGHEECGEPHLGVLSSDHAAVDDETVMHRCVLPNVPFFPASQLVRAAGPESVEEDMCEVPRNVRTIDTGQEYFFKAAYDQHGFRREVEILAKIRNIANEHDLILRTSKILGLVYWDGQETTLMGMLLERIDGPTLIDAAVSASTVTKGKWMDQIDETVQKLHEHGLVWGDVKPDNVMIGPSGDAILIDFGGGGCTLEYVDPERQETVEGDLQGIRRMRKDFLGEF